MKRSGIGSHTLPNKGAKDDWLTPPHIIEALGPFDLDPCCPPDMPWKTAERMVAYPDNGMIEHWRGRVWFNPPYADIDVWMARMADYGRGTALTFARTETAWFFASVWSKATALFFLEGRLFFHHACGTRAKHNSGGPSVLIAYGQEDAAILAGGHGLKGKFIPLAVAENHPTSTDL